VFVAQRTNEPLRPREINPDVPRELDEYIMRLLAKDAADRPQSAAEVRDALRELRGELAARDAPWQALASGRVGSISAELPEGSSDSISLKDQLAAAIAEAAGVSAESAVHSASSWRRNKNRPKWLMAAALASLGILTLIIFLAVRH